MTKSPADKASRVRLNSKQKEIFEDVAKYILGVAVAGGLLAVAVTVPNLLLALKPLGRTKKFRYSERDIEKVRDKIFKDGAVKIVNKNGTDYLEITGRGRKALIEFNIDTIVIKNHRRDGKWRLVIFDIPEKDRSARNVLRSKLKEIGFIKLQQSVWISPYECENEISFIAATYHIEKYVNYIVAEKVDTQKCLEEIFKE